MADPVEEPTEETTEETVEYTVVSGDSLSVIAARNDMTLDELKALNPGLFDSAHNGGNLISVGETVILSGSPSTSVEGEDSDVEDPEVQAIPRDAKLVKVGNAYRVIWDLGEGMGFAWYDIGSDQLEDLYGEDYDTYVTETFSNAGSYEAKYKDYHWGNVAEISLKAEDPWQDLKERVFDSFGYISGMDSPEIKRLVLQSYFENWSDTEFLSHYKNTDYYNSLNDVQRNWATLSEAEQQTQISETAAQLANYYFSQYGIDPPGRLNNAQIQAAALQVASGVLSIEEWQYTTSRAAADQGNTPASRNVAEEQRLAGQQQVDIENTTQLVKEQWREWMGNTPMPSEFASKWANNIYLNNSSEADLLGRLQVLSSKRWENKPPEVSWAEWSAPTRGQIESYLELSNLEDSDGLLNDIMDKGYKGRDVVLAIKADERYKETNRYFKDVSGALNEVGKTFGYIS